MRRGGADGSKGEGEGGGEAAGESVIVAQLHKAGNNGPSSWAKGQGARQIKG